MAHSLPDNSECDDQVLKPRFHLRTLLMLVALLCVTLAISRNVSPMAVAVAILFILAIAAHVAGNVLGSHLRDEATAKNLAESPRRRFRVSVADCAPTTRLSHRTPLGSTVVVLTLMGAMAGGYGGCEWLSQSIPHEDLTIANLSLGASSFVVLGGFFGFWIGSFLRVFLVATFQAQRESGQRQVSRRDVGPVQ